MSDRLIGSCRWFNNERGYGFIVKEDDETTEYFVHFSNVKMDGYKTLKTNQRVEFELLDTDKGIQATEVIPIEEEE